MSPSLFNVVFKHNTQENCTLLKKKTLTAIYTIHLQNCQFKSLWLIFAKNGESYAAVPAEIRFSCTKVLNSLEYKNLTLQ